MDVYDAGMCVLTQLWHQHKFPNTTWNEKNEDTVIFDNFIITIVGVWHATGGVIMLHKAFLNTYMNLKFMKNSKWS